jgi:tetratricopeptide (TPR) repeat protein
LTGISNRQGRHEETIAAARKGLALAPNHIGLLYTISIAHCMLGEFEESRHRLETVVALRPDFRPARLLLGGAYVELKLYEAALEQFKVADSLRPLEPEVRHAVEQIRSLYNKPAPTHSDGSPAR